jgi:hypothetical protein
VPPSVVRLDVPMGQRQHVVRSTLDGAQDGSAFDRKWLRQLSGEVRGRQRHAAYLGVEGPELSTSSASAFDRAQLLLA